MRLKNTFALVVMEPVLADFAMAAAFIECMAKAVPAAVLTENAANAAARVISCINIKRLSFDSLFKYLLIANIGQPGYY